MKWQFGVKQNYFFSNPKKWRACGVCSIYFALRKMRYDITLSKLLLITKSEIGLELINPRGLDISEIRSVFNLFKIKTRIKYFLIGEEEKFYNSLKKFATPNKPLLIFPDGHAIAVTQINGNSVYYMEPDNLSTIISCKSFSLFCDYSFGEKGFVEMMILDDPI